MLLHPLSQWCDLSLLQVSFSGDRCGFTPNARVLTPGGTASCCAAPLSTIGTHHPCHRGKLSVLKASIYGWMPVHGMSKHRPNVAMELCWPWCSSQGNMVQSPVLQGFIVSRNACCCEALEGRIQSSMMGLLRVKDIATPEVKFLDRCKINCSEGVLQGHVRRSRM